VVDDTFANIALNFSKCNKFLERALPTRPHFGVTCCCILPEKNYLRNINDFQNVPSSMLMAKINMLNYIFFAPTKVFIRVQRRTARSVEIKK